MWALTACAAGDWQGSLILTQGEWIGSLRSSGSSGSLSSWIETTLRGSILIWAVWPSCFSSSQSDITKHRKAESFPRGRFLPSSYRWAQSQMLQTVIRFKVFSSLFEQSWRCKTFKSSRTQRISSTQERHLVLKIKRLLIEEKTYKHKIQRK